MIWCIDEISGLMRRGETRGEKKEENMLVDRGKKLIGVEKQRTVKEICRKIIVVLLGLF